MKKALSVFAVALLIAAIGVVSAPRTDAQAAENPGIRPQQETMQYPGADNITIYLECQFDGRTRLRLQWSTYNMGIQFEDLSLFNNGWLFGTFIGIGPFAPNQSTSVWEGLVPGQWHYLRINTLTRVRLAAQPDAAVPLAQRLLRTAAAATADPSVPAALSAVPAAATTVPGSGRLYGDQHNRPRTWPATARRPSECPATATILIYPPPGQGCVFVRRGTGSTYFQGESFEVCYWVNQPMYVRIVHQGPSGAQEFVNGYDDGRGGCVWSPTPLGGPGGRSETLYGNNGQVLDTTTFNVQ